MNNQKALYFDSQIASPWASQEYTPLELLKISAIISSAGITRGSKILEPGCGTGRLTEILSDHVGLEGLVVTSDISEQMIEQCRERLLERNNVRIHHACVETLAFPEEFFDVVLCHNVFPHFDDKPGVTKCLAKCLRIGGTFVVSHFDNSEWINDMHRKVDPSVVHDMIPSRGDMEMIFHDAGLIIQDFEDGDSGYLLKAVRFE